MVRCVWGYNDLSKKPAKSSRRCWQSQSSPNRTVSTKKRYEALRAENSSDSKELDLIHKRIYPGIAVWSHESRGHFSRKGRLVYPQYFQRLAVKSAFFQRAIKTFSLARKFPYLFVAGVKKSCQSNAGFVYELPESHYNEARINIVRCPYFEICKRYGCPEITLHTAIVMTQDMATCTQISSGVVQNHRTRWWFCDFLLEYKEE